jgi:tetratricopeptide (TPR) repeat protein
MNHIDKILYVLILATAPMNAHATTAFKPEAGVLLPVQLGLPLSDNMQQLSERLQLLPQDATRLELATLYASGARAPGFSPWFHQAGQLLSEVTPSGTTSVAYRLLQADLQQQQHKFDLALQTLDSVFDQAPRHIQASLMAARIYLAQHQPELAQQACARLWQQDLFLFSVCSYEVAGRRGEWEQSYIALQMLWQRQKLAPQLDIWLRGILAEQAEQLQLLATAQQWLTPVLDTAPTSLWLKWADLSLQLGQATEVYQRLAKLQQQYALSDGLLLRLALAERQLHKAPVYAAVLEPRIALRLARGDTDHAADLAHYFLRFKPNASAALQWAEVNYRSAKEPDDVALLAQSHTALQQENQQ